MAGMKWVKHRTDDYDWWDLVHADTYEKGDDEAWCICYREVNDKWWHVMYDDELFPKETGLDDGNVSKNKFPTYQKLRKHLMMQYLLLRK